MKKILFSLMALVASMSMNAQVMKIMKNGEVEATYKGSEYSVVFEEEQGSTTTGTAKAKIGGSEVDVNWVQLWAGGPKFAEYNVGVTNGKAESCGGYYAWGGSQYKFDDHNTGSSVLTGDNDTATKLWGAAWRMPTKAELGDLLANCNVAWTTVNGVEGRKFTGKGDYASNSVFLPAAGNCRNGDVDGQGNDGSYWSSTPNGSSYAYCLNFSSGGQGVAIYGRRYIGYSVRAVFEEEPAGSTTTGTAKATIGGSEVDVNWVQLWENGPKFADRNVEGTMNFTDATKTGADYVWGTNWCTPSKDDMGELLKAATYDGSEKVTCSFTQESGVYGFKFTGKETGYTENSVFFPAQDVDSYIGYGLAFYWSGTANGSRAWYMGLRYQGGYWVSDWLSSGQDFNYLVRPVLKN